MGTWQLGGQVTEVDPTNTPCLPRGHGKKKKGKKADSV